MSKSPKLANISWCGKDVIKLRILRWEAYPGLFRWALNAITSVLIEERQRQGKTTHLEEKATTDKKREQRVGWGGGHEPKNICSPHSQKQQAKGLQGRVSLYTPGFQTSDLQKRGCITDCCLKPRRDCLMCSDNSRLGTAWDLLTVLDQTPH